MNQTYVDIVGNWSTNTDVVNGRYGGIRILLNKTHKVTLTLKSKKTFSSLSTLYLMTTPTSRRLVYESPSYKFSLQHLDFVSIKESF